MLFYYYIVLFETAGIESEIYAALAVGGSRNGAYCYFPQDARVRHSLVWHRRQYERSFCYVYRLYCDDSDGDYIHCFQTGQEGQKAGTGNRNLG